MSKRETLSTAVTRLLHQAHNGADPDLLYAETYANSEHEEVSGD